MAVRIHITDFQSVADAQIVVDRFTAVTGPNNSGKTATMRAVQGVFANTPGDAFVRHGAEKLSVDIDFGDGHKVKWSKGPKLKPTYVIDGKEINPGRGVPDELQVFGIEPVRAGSTEVWPQIAPQFTGQVFLLDMPGSALAEAVADVERVGKLTQALRLAETDKRAASSELKLRTKDVQRYKDELADMAGLDSIEASIISIEQVMADCGAASTDIDALRSLKERLAQCRQDCGVFAGFQKVLVPATETVVAARAEVQVLRDLHRRVQAARREMQSLAGASDVHVPAKPTEALLVREELRTCRTLRASHRKAKEALAKTTEAIAASAVMVPLRETKVQKLAQNLTWLRDLTRRKRAAKVEFDAAAVALQTSQKQLTEVAVTVRTLLGTRGECPTCRTVMEAP